MATSAMGGDDPAVPVPGILPGTGQYGAHHLLLRHPRLHIRLQPGHQDEGNFFSRENFQEEKAKPLNIEKDPSEKRNVFKAEM